MRILAYTHAYPGPLGHQAGGETSLHDALRHLAGQGHDVLALVGDPTPCPSYVLDGVTVRTVQTTGEAKAAPLALFGWADVVVTQLKHSYRAAVLARMHSKPVVHYAHNDHRGTRKPLGMSDVGLYNTDWVRESCRENGVHTPGIVLHPIVEPSRYHVDTANADCVTLINLSMGGDGMYDKGWKTFFELARRNPDIKFLGVHGAYGEQAHLDLPNLHYMPHQEDIREVYRRTRVLLVPSKYESFGRVAVEAAASGIPSVCTPTDGLKEAMGDGALYAPYGDYDIWNERLKDLWCDGRRTYDNGPGWISRMRSASAYRSYQLWKQSQTELEELSLVFEILGSAGLGDLYDYLSVR